MSPLEPPLQGLPSWPPFRPYPADQLAEGEVDQAVLQKGPGPAEVIGAVAGHVGQAPGGRETSGCTGAGLWGGFSAWGQSQLPGGLASNIHAGQGPGIPTCVRSPGQERLPAARWGQQVRGQGSLLTDDVELLANFQVAPGWEGESWMWVESNGEREEERGGG